MVGRERERVTSLGRPSKPRRPPEWPKRSHRQSHEAERDREREREPLKVSKASFFESLEKVSCLAAQELHLMHDTMKLAVEPPPLPEMETSHGFARLLLSWRNTKSKQEI